MAAVDRIAYQDLAAVYDWLVPETLLTPEGSAAAFEAQIAQIEPGSRVLDCACGTGTLAVGLAKRGFAVSASDASPAMVERTRALANEHGTEIQTKVSRWGELAKTWPTPFIAAFCVGNALTHAEDRRQALTGIRSALTPGGLLVLTSRNWERVRAEANATETTVERHGQTARVEYRWEIPPAWDDPHHMDITVALPESTHSERLTFWPFTHETLEADLRATGFEPRDSTYADAADRYLVTATSASSRSR